jgi:transposase
LTPNANKSDTTRQCILFKAELARWYNDVQNIGLKQFNTVINTMQINYFDNRSTNAAAKSFNTKIKAFRARFRGVRDID